MCLFAPLPSQGLEVWLWLLPSPIAHIPNGKKKYNCFPKTFSVGLFLLSVGAGFKQGKGNPIPIRVRKQGPENTCAAFEELQPGISGMVSLNVFASLYTFPDPEIETSLFFFGSIAGLYRLAGTTELQSVGLLLHSSENCVSGVSNGISDPAILDTGLGRKTWLWNSDSSFLLEHQAF